MKTLKILSCLGHQVELQTIEALDSQNRILSFSMVDTLQLCLKEGILEKAGPLYQFTHGILHQTVYSLIASDSHRSLLHKTIGTNLLEVASNNPTLQLLAVDQINLFCGVPSAEERLQFASNNAQAAKLAIASSSFEQARSYIDAGIKLLELDNEHWETQYALSLDLFELSASVSCMHGETESLASTLQEIFAHAKTFNDTLKASSLYVKLLAALSKFDVARDNCLAVLSNLGEEIASDVSLPLVQSELSAMQTMLRNVTAQQIKQLPQMTDCVKLNTMKFYSMTCLYSQLSKPLLLPRLAFRMLQLTREHGYCDDTIVGLATGAYSIFLFSEDVPLACQVGKMSDVLVDESPRKHILRSRLCRELALTVKLTSEPWTTVVDLLIGVYNSALLAGDVESATSCRIIWAGASFVLGGTHLSTSIQRIEASIQESAKFGQSNPLHIGMVMYNSCMDFIGGENDNPNVRSLNELNATGLNTNTLVLVWHVFSARIRKHFWFREYTSLTELSMQYSERHPSSSEGKQFLNIYRCFYEGISYLRLARDTNQSKWRMLGEKCMRKMAQFEAFCQYNYNNKVKLLWAEFHYLTGDMESAEASYKASIESSRKHKIISEEALGYELYGVFCIETGMAEKGLELLRVAVDNYMQWGATKKASSLQDFVKTIAQAV